MLPSPTVFLNHCSLIKTTSPNVGLWEVAQVSNTKLLCLHRMVTAQLCCPQSCDFIWPRVMTSWKVVFLCSSGISFNSLFIYMCFCSENNEKLNSFSNPGPKTRSANLFQERAENLLSRLTRLWAHTGQGLAPFSYWWVIVACPPAKRKRRAVL